MAKSSDLVVGLDIGTTKICAVVGELSPEGVDVGNLASGPARPPACLRQPVVALSVGRSVHRNLKRPN